MFCPHPDDVTAHKTLAEKIAPIKLALGEHVPHVGDMGQLHQHLVLFNHIGIEHPALFLEHIPHLREHFVHPVQVTGGVYQTPQEAGSSCDLRI